MTENKTENGWITEKTKTKYLQLGDKLVTRLEYLVVGSRHISGVLFNPSQVL